ncbi:MAG: hypothetical protein H0W88_02755 [Parachlamydiaceae bacterium]|nr:hypothetical protein [Parachlamydiaceae bacterium]
MDLNSIKLFFESNYKIAKDYISKDLWAPLTLQQKMVAKAVAGVFSVLTLGYIAKRLWSRKVVRVDNNGYGYGESKKPVKITVIPDVSDASKNGENLLGQTSESQRESKEPSSATNDSNQLQFTEDNVVVDLSNSSSTNGEATNGVKNSETEQSASEVVDENPEANHHDDEVNHSDDENNGETLIIKSPAKPSRKPSEAGQNDNTNSVNDGETLINIKPTEVSSAETNQETSPAEQNDTAVDKAVTSGKKVVETIIPKTPVKVPQEQIAKESEGDQQPVSTETADASEAADEPAAVETTDPKTPVKPATATPKVLTKLIAKSNHKPPEVVSQAEAPPKSPFKSAFFKCKFVGELILEAKFDGKGNLHVRQHPLTGTGKVIFSDSAYSSGTFVDGGLEGDKCEKSVDGTVRSGTFGNNELVDGTKQYPDGELHAGSFDENERLVGIGLIETVNANFEGNFVDYHLQGAGKVTNHSTGLKFEGTFEKGIMIKCTKVTVGGVEFEGDFVNEDADVDFINSTSLSYKYIANDDAFVGEIKNGVFNGKGKGTWENDDGFVITATGQFKDNLYCEKVGKAVWMKDGVIDQTHEGCFVNNLLEGNKCSIKFANGDDFTGTFKAGKLHGEGKKSLAVGQTIAQGNFVNGTFVIAIEEIKPKPSSLQTMKSPGISSRTRARTKTVKKGT